MSSIGERVKQIRVDHLKLTREKLAESLSTSASVIVNIEMDRLARPEQKVPLLQYFCRKYKVSEKYIFEGEGSWEEDSFDEDTYARAAKELSDDPFVKSHLIAYWKSGDDKKKAIYDFVTEVYSSMQKLKEED